MRMPIGVRLSFFVCLMIWLFVESACKMPHQLPAMCLWGCTSSGGDLAHVQLAPGNVATGYPSNYSLGWIGPAGDLYSTALDLAKFLKFMVKPNTHLLSASSIREWTQQFRRLGSDLPCRGRFFP